MKLIKRKKFLEMPEGILFCSGERWVFSGIRLKFETIGNDFYDLSFNWIESDSSYEIDEKFSDMLDNGKSYPMQESSGRDGGFDEKELFLIYEKEDLIRLRDYINSAIEICDEWDDNFSK